MVRRVCKKSKIPIRHDVVCKMCKRQCEYAGRRRGSRRASNG